MIFKRYSDPFSFMDSMLDYGSFSNSISRLYELNNDDILWEFFLHKVSDKTYEEFRNSNTNNHLSLNKVIMTRTEFDTTVAMSKSILDSIDPTGRDGEKAC